MPFYQKEREVMRSRLAKCCFCNERKIEKDFEKKKWHVKIHAKMPFYQKERGSRLAKCCFCNGSKIEKDFEKKKWHVKIHGKMPSY